MNEYMLNIFALYYKRIMKVEDKLKSLLIEKYTDLYMENVYKITYSQYFSKTEKNKHSKDGIYTKLHNSDKSEIEKFTQAVRKMYLSEVINFLGNPVFLKSKIRKNFFIIPTTTNTTDFQHNSRMLNQFRNCVAHIDEKKLSHDINAFLEGLNYFENILGFDNIVIINKLKQLDPKHKLSTAEILQFIYTTDKSLFEDDKVLIATFDDVAIMNGYTPDSLPQRWTILRQKLKVESKNKGDNTITEANS